jgi:hypothetical protein
MYIIAKKLSLSESEKAILFSFSHIFYNEALETSRQFKLIKYLHSSADHNSITKKTKWEDYLTSEIKKIPMMAKMEKFEVWIPVSAIIKVDENLWDVNEAFLVSQKEEYESILKFEFPAHRYSKIGAEYDKKKMTLLHIKSKEKSNDSSQ